MSIVSGKESHNCRKFEGELILAHLLQEVKMNNNYEKYAYQISCMNTLKKHDLLTEAEYNKFKKHIQRKYKIIEGIEACTT